MRICVLALDDPWKERHGGTIRTRLLVDALVAVGHETSVAYVADANAPPPRSAGVDVRSVPGRPVGDRAWVRALGPLKRRLLPLPTMRGGMIGSLGRVVADAAPDVLVVSQLRAAPYVDCAPGATLWLDQADVWSAFLRREIARRRGLARLTASAQLRHIRKLESDWCLRAAGISAAGYGDRAYLSELANKPVDWLPTAVAGRDVARGSGATPTAGFLANFAFWPNRDAFTVLRDQWAPALSRQGWRVVVAGLHSDKLDGGKHVEVIGPVSHIDHFYSLVDVALAPLRLGGGIKVKIVEALMLRRPVIASSYALTGLPPDLAAAIMTVDDTRPDFSILDSCNFDHELAFSLAARYFSIETWTATVARIANTIAESKANT